MNVTREKVRQIVAEVIGQLGPQEVGLPAPAVAKSRVSAAPGPIAAGKGDIPQSDRGIFGAVEQAVRAARKASREFSEISLDTRGRLIAEMRRIMLDHVDRLSRLAVEETGLGRVEDKQSKNRLAITKTPGLEDLEPRAWSGDGGLTLMERAPWGVIGSIIPCTNPTETIISNAIGMIAAGNAVVFNPHPAAARTSNFCISLLNGAIESSGGPPNLLCSIESPTIETARRLMEHPEIDLLVVTGGPAVVRAAMGSGKRVIAAGPGNPPAVVDETALLEKAGRDLVLGHSLDNNIVCTDEKEVVVVESVAEKLLAAMEQAGAVRLDAEEARRLTAKVLAQPGCRSAHGQAAKEFIGKDAAILAAAIGKKVPDGTRCLVADVPLGNPLLWTEQLMPVLPVVRVRDADAAIELAVDLEKGYRHTASMHSLNLERLSRMARLIRTSIFIKNGPNYAGLGLGGEGYASFTIATPTGEGLTSARHFTRERRCSLIGYFRIA
jgi:acyl-CoA reductase-like NAD-dependent aldehyde dehydrogenase